VESKIVIATSCRVAMFREWRAPGSETQRYSLQALDANQTGDAHGRPSPSAVASVMYMISSTIRLAISAGFSLAATV
jgi:hypothetical protein